MGETKERGGGERAVGWGEEEAIDPAMGRWLVFDRGRGGGVG